VLLDECADQPILYPLPRPRRTIPARSGWGVTGFGGLSLHSQLFAKIASLWMACCHFPACEHIAALTFSERRSSTALRAGGGFIRTGLGLV
jgi:hypothetical protein